MSQPRSPLFSLIPRPMLILTLMLLSGSAVRAEALSVQEPSPLLAQAITPQERAELAQIRRDADVAFSRATTLFVVLLGTLVL
ncbi:MAG: hypothetical protein ICV62_03345, partial [Cyanobacteria bacterium Co-bin13]|nr:hypothetical protein [Cyanobacteria bacterium Co-bin13]